MERLTVGDILQLLNALKKNGMTLEEIKKLPIYLGDDEELNGIHVAWCIDSLEANTDDREVNYLRDMVNENRNNIKLADDVKAILIS